MAVFHAETALLPQGWARDVLIESDAAGMIRRVETAAPPPPGALRLAVVVPGMPNLHSHAFQRAMAGRAERRGPGVDSFWTWREAMYALVARITPATQRAIAAMVQAECLERGYTHLCEFHYLHRRPDGSPWPEADAMAEGHIAAALEESGIGLTLLPSLYRYGGIFGRDPAPGQRPFLLELAEYLALLRRLERYRGSRIALGVAPHSLRAVSPDMLAAVAQATDGPIHIHLAEQRREVEECLAATGLTPGAWMLARGHAGPRWCFIHATHLTATEVEELAASGAVAGLCPQTEASLGDGIFALPEWMAAGGRIGIGSDSQVCLDPAAELRQLETSQRLKLEQRAIAGSQADPHPGARLFRAALAGGAQAAGVPIGAIAAGKRCDLVELDPDHPDLIGLSGDALLDAWVFGPGRGQVRRVAVAGQLVVEGGRHLRAGRIAEAYRRALLQIWP